MHALLVLFNEMETLEQKGTEPKKETFFSQCRTKDAGLFVYLLPAFKRKESLRFLILTNGKAFFRGNFCGLGDEGCNEVISAKSLPLPSLSPYPEKCIISQPWGKEVFPTLKYICMLFVAKYLGPLFAVNVSSNGSSQLGVLIFVSPGGWKAKVWFRVKSCSNLGPLFAKQCHIVPVVNNIVKLEFCD